MRPLPIPKTASQVMKNFRTRELEGLLYHLRLHGPLPSEGTPKDPSIVLPNPFIPRKNPKTGKWRDPKYSLRRQADLVKKAKEVGDLGIIPPGPKLYALELRMKRLQASLSPTDAAIVSQVYANAGKHGIVDSTLQKSKKGTGRTVVQDATNSEPKSDAPVPNRISVLEKELQERQEKLSTLERDLESKESQRELDELATFEESETDTQGRKERQAEYVSLQDLLTVTRQEVVKAAQTLEKAKKDQEMLEAEKAREKLWSNPHWVGDVKRKAIEGEDLGIKLYAGKKKMFKGHLWEKQKARRLRKQKILMRDMKARVERYKSYYKKRKPNPLRPSRLTKPPKLPF